MVLHCPPTNKGGGEVDSVTVKAIKAKLKAMVFKKLTLHTPSPRGAESWMMEGGSAGVMKLQELPLGSTSRSTSYGVFGMISGFSEIFPHPTALPILPSNLVSDVPFVVFNNGDINVH